MSPHRLRRVAPGRHPFELATLLVAVFGGLAVVVSHHRPRSVTETMPPPVQVLWLTGLISAGVIGLIGTSWRGRLSTSLATELLSMILLGSATTMFTIALAAGGRADAIAAGAFIGGWALAAWWRAVQIVADLRRLTQPGRVVAVPMMIEDGDR